MSHHHPLLQHHIEKFSLRSHGGIPDEMLLPPDSHQALHEQSLFCNRNNILDFSSNINFLGPPEKLLSALQLRLTDVHNYPSMHLEALSAKIAAHHNCKAEEIVIGSGALDLLFRIARLKYLSAQTQKTSIGQNSQYKLPPSSTIKIFCANLDFYGYIEAQQSVQARLIEIPLDNHLSWDIHALRISLQQTRISNNDQSCFSIQGIVFLGHPHNPTGKLLPLSAIKLLTLAQDFPNILFVIDESFIDFSQHNHNYFEIPNIPLNIIVVRSLTKFFSIPGLRIGYLRSHQKIASQLRLQNPVWAINSLAETAAYYIFNNYTDHGLCQTIKQWRYIHDNMRKFVYQGLSRRGFTAIPQSFSNFILIEHTDVPNLFQFLLTKKKILIKVFKNFPNYFRIAIRSASENRELLNSLHEYQSLKNTNSIPSFRKSKKQAQALMIAGTASDVGKSLFVTALGRIFAEEGIAVAPFKAQNMSLESMVTNQGLEIAHSQAFQAQACKIEADVRMNPILLKPSKDSNNNDGSHVIVCGKSIGFFAIIDYQPLKRRLFGVVKKQYRSLAKEFELILLEGAGSLVEVNLKKNDLVNLRMATYANARILIVGDIERGGVFASFAGLTAMLAHWERSMIYGFIINKFRGDISLLKDAKDIIWQHCGKPLLGIVPYFEKLFIPYEDSLSLDNQMKNQKNHKHKSIHIGVLRLPYIAQFSDFKALEIEPDVQLTFFPLHSSLVSQDFTDLSLLIIPGSRNTQKDLKALQYSGIQSILSQILNQQHCAIWGVCGGYQMLGKKIIDPKKIEGNKNMSALGLLDFTTTMYHQKTLKKRQAYHHATRSYLNVYEIHHGIADQAPNNTSPIISADSTATEGLIFCHNHYPIYGGYLHGIFDNDNFRHYFLNTLREKRGLLPIKDRPTYNVEKNIDYLADEVRKYLRPEKIIANLKL